MISAYLTAAGWKNVYVPETVQQGLVPDSVRKHNNQRTRWTAAFIVRIGVFWTEQTGLATTQQRVGTTVLCLVGVLTNAVAAFSAVAIPWVLFTRSQTVIYQSPRQLQILLYLESLSFFAGLISGFARSRSGRSYGPIFFDWDQVGVSPFQAETILRGTISALIGRKLQSFAPSSRPRRGSFRFWFQKVDLDLLANISIFAAYLAGGYVGLRAVMAAAQKDSLIRCLFSQAGYPAVFLLWGKYVLQSGSPIPLMMSSQPVWPLRESLLVRDPLSKVAYPSEEATNPHRTNPSQTFAKLALFYHCIVLVSAWSLC